MEIRKGYKQTEIGILPSDWAYDTLEQNIKEMTDFVAAGSFESLRHNVKVYDNENYAIYVRLMDLRLGLGHNSQKYVDDSSYKFLSKSNLFGNEILMANIGANVGETFLMPELKMPATIAPNMIIIRADNNKLHYNYLYYYTQSDFGQNRVFELIAGSGHPKVNKTDLKKYKVIIPPLPEQTAIATALSDTDALISKLEELINKKRNIKQGAMQELLTGKRRLPGFSGEWKEKKLGDILSYEQPTKYLVKSTEYYDNNDIAVLTANKSFILGYTDENEGVFENIPVIIFDDFTTATKYVNFPFKVKSSALKILKLKDESTDLRFVFGKMQLIRFPLGDHKRYWISEYQHIEIEVPSIKEQTAIAQILSDMDMEIEQLEQKLDKYKMIKQGMMHELLTGRIRLIDTKAYENPKAQLKIVAGQDCLQKKGHNWEFDKAVVISVLVNKFGDSSYPLGRKRYTKLSYLFDRHIGESTEGYLKKAAGPYNPSMKYGGPEKIAQKRGYVKVHSNGKYSGFIVDHNIDEAVKYFNEWYDQETLKWLEQFRYKKNDDLELLTTVDKAILELPEGREVSVASVKDIIQNNDEWRPKLDRPIFSDVNISAAIKEIQELFNT
jgi:type I restriction enzyme S subunit